MAVTGAKEIYVENYKCLLDYREDLIILQGKKETIEIHGCGFLIEYFANDGMKIKGCISSIVYQSGNNKVKVRR